MEGLTEAGLDRLIKAGFSLLGLQTFLTAGEMESRAWTIVKGFTAPQAAGKIHSDFEKGSSVLKLFPTMTSLPVAANRLPVKRAL